MDHSSGCFVVDFPLDGTNLHGDDLRLLCRSCICYYDIASYRPHPDRLVVDQFADGGTVNGPARAGGGSRHPASAPVDEPWRRHLHLSAMCRELCRFNCDLVEVMSRVPAPARFDAYFAGSEKGRVFGLVAAPCAPDVK